MNVLRGDKWSSGYLDYYKSTDQVRLGVEVWAPVMQVVDQYFIPSKDWRLLWNYYQKVGCAYVLRKTVSRLRERGRNQKFLSIGVGSVEGSAKNGRFSCGTKVVFLAYNHPRCVDRVTLEECFLCPSPGLALSNPSKGILLVEKSDWDCAPQLAQFAGWHPLSEIPLNREMLASTLASAALELAKIIPQMDHDRAIFLPVSERPLVSAREASRCRPTADHLSATLFGYGNYAKTIIIPNLNDRIRISCIHEIDPLQIGPGPHEGFSFNTCGLPRNDGRSDVYLIAGYHHTHAPIAIHAIREGSWAITEKPVATTRDQLSLLTMAMQEYPGKFFACFHKRYLVFNELALVDLGVQAGEAIHYHCIVYEVPLPNRHWYRWPASGSRIISNGCHWIDHFLFLNSYSPVIRRELHEASNEDLVIMLELVNGAVFSMTLTHTGSARIGVRDYVEVKTGNVTVRMIDGRFYQSENQRRILRTLRINPMASYNRMYRAISARIANKQPGDLIASLSSTEATLQLEEILHGERRRKSTRPHQVDS